MDILKCSMENRKYVIKDMKSLYEYIERIYERRLSKAEKGIIRFRMVVLRKSVKILFKELGISSEDVIIK